MTETWKPIMGYEGKYEVSCLGRVRSFVPSKKAPEMPHLLSQGNLRGYKQVCLPRLNAPGKYKAQFVHRLVARAFLGKEPTADATVNHKDRDRANNQVENLEWMSHADNVMHAKDLIPRNRGEANHSKLLERDVRAIRTLYATKEWTYEELGEKFGVSGQTAWLIVSRRKWRHVK